LTNADRITRPLLVVQGKNDPWVPASQTDLVVNKLRARGTEVWYLLAADEGHVFRKKQDRDAYYTAFALFLTKLIQPEPP
jgi:dipeptidyl aminopeptidase/acylaminoacyl peptidase